MRRQAAAGLRLRDRAGPSFGLSARSPHEYESQPDHLRLPGKPFPARRYVGLRGLHFALFSEHAEGVSVLFDDRGAASSAIPLREQEDQAGMLLPERARQL